MKKSILLSIAILLLFSFAEAGEKVVFGMCRPLVVQIKNIQHMYEKGVIPADDIELICVYHEDEVTNYKPSYNYVKKERLHWVKFFVIKGQVEVKDLFRKNLWTPQFKKLFDKTRGLIVTGGMDLPPVIYGAEENLMTEATTPQRSMYESSLLFHLVGRESSDFTPFLKGRPDYAVLGICLGAQSLNVATGGTLWQDIPSEVYGAKTKQDVLKFNRDKIHSNRYISAMCNCDGAFSACFHRIKIKKNSLLVKKMKIKSSSTPYVHSSHHQAVKKLGRGLVITATSMDGKIVEMVEHKRFKNVLGVQFHPEHYSLYSKTKRYVSSHDRNPSFSPRNFLKQNGNSMKFHLKIWEWFAKSMIAR